MAAPAHSRGGGGDGGGGGGGGFSSGGSSGGGYSSRSLQVFPLRQFRTSSPYKIYFWGAVLLLVMIVKLYKGTADREGPLFSIERDKSLCPPAQSGAKAAGTLALLERLCV